MHVLYFVLIILGAVLGAIIGQAISKTSDRYFCRRRDKAFLRFARITFPNSTVIESISIAESDKQALENIERRLRNASRTL